ncbi:hypothetical protein TNCV_4752471 [Trichonephila clavipes]|nr:hypothetical protein TNCV_4752471 [Trichonephila clavipes]
MTHENIMFLCFESTLQFISRSGWRVSASQSLSTHFQLFRYSVMHTTVAPHLTAATSNEGAIMISIQTVFGVPDVIIPSVWTLVLQISLLPDSRFVRSYKSELNKCLPSWALVAGGR